MRRSPAVLHVTSDKGRDRSSDDARRCFAATLKETAEESEDTADNGAESTEQEHGFRQGVQGSSSTSKPSHAPASTAICGSWAPAMGDSAAATLGLER